MVLTNLVSENATPRNVGKRRRIFGHWFHILIRLRPRLASNQKRQTGANCSQNLHACTHCLRMWARGNHGRINASRRVGYVWPKYPSWLFRSVSQRPAPTTDGRNILQPGERVPQSRVRSSSNQRPFNTTSSSQVLEEVSSTTTAAEIPQSIPIRKHFGPPPLRGPAGAPDRPSIRDRLRAWSVENQRKVVENAPDGIQSTGREAALPSPLFMEETRNDAEEDHEEDGIGEDESVEFDEYDDLVEGEYKVRLVPGDLIMATPKIAKRQFAIFLGMAGLQHQLLLADGRWLSETMMIPETLVVPNFASPDEIASILEYTPKRAVEREDIVTGVVNTMSATGDIPQTVAAPLLRRIAAMHEDLITFRREHVHHLDSVYDSLADEVHYVYLTIEELTQKLLGLDFSALSAGAKMAIFQALEKQPTWIQTRRQLEDSILVIFTPKKFTRQFSEVVSWARDYQEAAAQAAVGKEVASMLQRNPLSAFIDKARRLILKSRKIRSPTTIGSLGPSSRQDIDNDTVVTKATGEIYTENDKMILEFLWNTYLRQPQPKKRNMHHAIGSLILRAIGAYPKLTLESKIGKLLLQELGSLAPWAEKTDESVIFPLPGRRGAHVSNVLYAESEKLCEELAFDPETGYNPLPDSMAELRTDLGSLPVFCVDKPSTYIIDDGFSWEPCEDDPEAFWIHCHVAHPTAYLSPNHVFAQRARILGANLYTSRNTFPMMPWPVVKTLGLAPNSAALTVSTRLTADGQVQDIRVFPSVVRNVIRLERGAVEKLMGKEEKEKAYLIVGRSRQYSMTTEDDATPEAVDKARPYLDTFQKLDTILRARVRARQKEAPLHANWEFSYSEQSAKVSFLEPYDVDRLLHSYHYHGDPTIKCVADRYETVGRHGEGQMNDDVTAHVMMLAAESVGRWFRERDIPACFSGALTHPEFPLSKLNTMDRYERFLSPMATLSSSPVPHVMLNVAQYLRFTSPLRRFTDLLSHWQVDAYLKAEAQGLIRSGAKADGVDLPFTRAMVDEYIAKNAHVITQGDRLMRESIVHWTMQALFRAFHFKEAELPEIWDFKVENTVSSKRSPDDTRVQGRIAPFGIRACLLASEQGWETGAKWRQYLPVKIELVDLSAGMVSCRAVGPPNDTVNCKHPIRAGPKFSA